MNAPARSKRPSVTFRPRRSAVTNVLSLSAIRPNVDGDIRCRARKASISTETAARTSSGEDSSIGSDVFASFIHPEMPDTSCIVKEEP